MRCSLRAVAALALLQMLAVPGAWAADAAVAPKSPAEAVQPFVERDAVAGAVLLVADKDRVLNQESVGYADVATGKPMANDALFWIASQSKSLTAAGLMILVDEGQVALDDPVEKFLPEFKDLWLADERTPERLTLTRSKQPITVRQILSHTSGLPFKSKLEEPRLDQWPLEAGARSYAMTPLDFQPGEKYQYSNAGINAAGRIIEVVSGQPYVEFMEARLLKPLGMNDTTFFPSGALLARLAKAYKPNAARTGLEETTIAQLDPQLDAPGRQPMPAGGYFTTASDCARFCQMLLRGGELNGQRVLSEQAVAEMTRKQTGDLPNGYGLGLAINGRQFGHGGAYATNMNVDPEHGLITVYLVQHAGFPKDGKDASAAFKQAATEIYGK